MATERVVARQGPSGTWHYVEIAGANKADELGVPFLVEEPNGA